ncbi:hypothetical protein pb186bvf_014037 [Paramecium bursaria]
MSQPGSGIWSNQLSQILMNKGDLEDRQNSQQRTEESIYHGKVQFADHISILMFNIRDKPTQISESRHRHKDFKLKIF